MGIVKFIESYLGVLPWPALSSALRVLGACGSYRVLPIVASTVVVEGAGGQQR